MQTSLNQEKLYKSVNKKNDNILPVLTSLAPVSTSLPSRTSIMRGLRFFGFPTASRTHCCSFSKTGNHFLFASCLPCKASCPWRLNRQTEWVVSKTALTSHWIPPGLVSQLKAASPWICCVSLASSRDREGNSEALILQGERC